MKSTDRQEDVPRPEHEERDGGELEQDVPLGLRLLELELVLQGDAQHGREVPG